MSVAPWERFKMPTIAALREDLIPYLGELAWSGMSKTRNVLGLTITDLFYMQRIGWLQSLKNTVLDRPDAAG